jgi:hypothetical protein
MKLDVFGRPMQVLRENDQWVIYLPGPDGKKRPLLDFVIPADLSESEVIVYIADIFHEMATPEKPEVKKLSAWTPV